MENRHAIADLRWRLPDGRIVCCTNRHNAAGIWHELAATVPFWQVPRFEPDDTILDVGAHVGLASLFIAGIASDLQVIACEPAGPSYDCLARNFARYLTNGLAINAAVGAKAGTAEFSYYPNIETMSTMYADNVDDRRNIEAALTEFGVLDAAGRASYWELARSDVQRYQVEVTTVSRLIADYGVRQVGLLKIDVERAEIDVLRGIDERAWPCIRNIVVEVHDIDGRLTEVLSLLERFGYQVDHFQPELLRGASVHMVVASRR